MNSNKEDYISDSPVMINPCNPFYEMNNQMLGPSRPKYTLSSLSSS